MNLFNKRFWLDKLLTKKFILYKSKLNSSVSSCQSAANHKFTPLNFWVPTLHS